MLEDGAKHSPKRLLDPIDRTSEVLFGLIMALTFTCSLGAAEAGRDDVHAMLIGTIGCNIAWGLIDAVFFLMTSLTERARSLATLRDLRKAPGAGAVRDVISDALPPMLAGALSDEDYARLGEKLKGLGEPPKRPRLGRNDFLGALGVFLLVFLATFPVVTPFLLMDDAAAALRVSNGIALVMLFLTGYSYGRIAKQHAWRTGLIMVLVGSAMVVVTIALGG